MNDHRIKLVFGVRQLCMAFAIAIASSCGVVVLGLVSVGDIWRTETLELQKRGEFVEWHRASAVLYDYQIGAPAGMTALNLEMMKQEWPKNMPQSIREAVEYAIKLTPDEAALLIGRASFGWPARWISYSFAYGFDDQVYAVKGAQLSVLPSAVPGGASGIVPLQVQWSHLILNVLILSLTFLVFANCFKAVFVRHRRRRCCCAVCGYSLSGIQGKLCPECGASS